MLNFVFTLVNKFFYTIFAAENRTSCVLQQASFWVTPVTIDAPYKNTTLIWGITFNNLSRGKSRLGDGLIHHAAKTINRKWDPMAKSQELIGEGEGSGNDTESSLNQLLSI